MDDLFGDDKTAIEYNVGPIGEKTTTVPLPSKDQGIEQHIANSIRKLVDDLRTEQPHPTTTNVAEEDQVVRSTTMANSPP